MTYLMKLIRNPKRGGIAYVAHTANHMIVQGISAELSQNSRIGKIIIQIREMIEIIPESRAKMKYRLFEVS